MSETAAAPHAAPAAERGTFLDSYLAQRLFSLFGIAPLGMYVILHLATNMKSLYGPQAWEAALAESRQSPLFVPLEIFGLGVPLLLHAAVGLRNVWKGRWNVHRYATFRNTKYVLMRISGIGLLLFLGAHVWLARISPSLLHGGPERFFDLAHELHTPPTFSVYALGILGIAFHLGNGLWAFCISWGLIVGKHSQRIVEALSIALFLAVLAMGGLSVYGFLAHS